VPLVCVLDDVRSKCRARGRGRVPCRPTLPGHLHHRLRLEWVRALRGRRVLGVSRRGHVDKFEVEQEDSSDPAVDGCVWLDVGVAEHTADVLRVHFYDQVSNSNDMCIRRARSVRNNP
jgi:hypothetical protein